MLIMQVAEPGRSRGGRASGRVDTQTYYRLFGAADPYQHFASSAGYVGIHLRNRGGCGRIGAALFWSTLWARAHVRPRAACVAGVDCLSAGGSGSHGPRQATFLKPQQT